MINIFISKAGNAICHEQELLKTNIIQYFTKEIEYIKNVEDKIDEILGVTTNDKVEDIISKPVAEQTEVYAIIFSDGTMELRKEKPTETENVVFNAERDTYTEVSINGEKLILDVEVCR